MHFLCSGDRENLWTAIAFVERILPHPKGLCVSKGPRIEAVEAPEEEAISAISPAPQERQREDRQFPVSGFCLSRDSTVGPTKNRWAQPLDVQSLGKNWPPAVRKKLPPVIPVFHPPWWAPSSGAVVDHGILKNR